MKRLVLIMIAVIFIVSCSDSTSPVGNRVVFSSGISQDILKSSVMKNSISIQNLSNADSIRITEFRMLISRVKFHGGNIISDDSSYDDSKSLNFVTGAFIVRSDSANESVLFADAELKPGTYNKIKVEMHRLTPSELNNYLTKPYFEDFVSILRPTFVVRGSYYQQGLEHAFTYQSDVVLNHTFNLNPPLEISESGEFRFVYELDTSVLFKDDNGNILVPNAENNNKIIEKNIKNCMRLVKK